MDPKKQDLNPELKEIYNRVMNTQVNQPAQGAQTPPPMAGQPTPPPPASTFNAPQPAASFPQAPNNPAPVSPPVEGSSFVFTGNKVKSQDPRGFQSTHASSKIKIPKPVIIVAVMLLVVGWAFFWAKFFGLI